LQSGSNEVRQEERQPEGSAISIDLENVASLVLRLRCVTAASPPGLASDPGRPNQAARRTNSQTANCDRREAVTPLVEVRPFRNKTLRLRIAAS
jgi:hypothetical protein